MTSRMERYHQSEQEKTESRTDKHKDLYEDFYTKTVYKEIGTLEDAIATSDAVDLSVMRKEKKTRESYHQVRELEDFMEPLPSKKDDSVSLFFQEEEKPKIYDINSVLEQAKRNRSEKDDLEKRRKLANSDYSVVTQIQKQEKKNQSKKKKTKEEELEELIHTITSSSLRKEIDDSIRQEEDTIEDSGADLLSDLMPTHINETLISEELSKAILDKENEQREEEKALDSLEEESEDNDTSDDSFEGTSSMDNTSEVADDEVDENGIDRTFYTRSMDLSDQDFDEELPENEFVEEKHPFLTFLKVLLAIALVVGIALLVFYLMSQL